MDNEDNNNQAQDNNQSGAAEGETKPSNEHLSLKVKGQDGKDRIASFNNISLLSTIPLNNGLRYHIEQSILTLCCPVLYILFCDYLLSR
jgi:hypothetical protein